MRPPAESYEIVSLPKNRPNVQTVGPTLLPHANAKVWHEHDTVVLEVGGGQLKMDYPMAIAISKMMLMHAKQAKKFAGDYRKAIQTDAVLTDAEFAARKNF